MRAVGIAAALLAVGLSGSASPAAAAAPPAAIAMRDLPLHGARSLAAAAAPGRFDMVGLHWRGTGSVRFRTRSVSGHWSAWRVADADAAPDRGSSEAAAQRGWRLGTPVWTGAADRLQYRTSGEVSRLRAYYVWSSVEHRSFRALSVSGSPAIVPRSVWGGDELPRRASPRYARAIRLVIVHHTATPNAYSPDQAAAIVRAIDVYHVKGNGWDDIGYNFLIDRYGHVYEGRAGGITRNVIGAHALGFNTGSVGIALIGNFTKERPPAAQLQALERLIAWRLDLAHVDPASTLTYVSNGSERYKPGRKVTLRAVSGHRDTGLTQCPGDAAYPLLGEVARAAQSIGLPKLYEPAVRGRLGGPITFAARLSSAKPWSVTVTGPDGTTVARATGNGSAIAWTWQSAGAKPGRYVWRISAGSALPARGVVGGGALPPAPPAAPLVTGLAVAPTTLSPNGDGYADVATVSYALTAAATVTATVVDPAGTAVATAVPAAGQAAGPVSLDWSPAALPDGTYTLSVSASAADGRTQSATAPFTVDRVLSSVAALPATVTPNGDGIDDTATFTFVLGGTGTVSVSVVAANGTTVATVFQGPLGPGSYSFGWNALGADALPVAPGGYRVVVSVTDGLGQTAQAAAFDVA